MKRRARALGMVDIAYSFGRVPDYHYGLLNGLCITAGTDTYRLTHFKSGRALGRRFQYRTIRQAMAALKEVAALSDWNRSGTVLQADQNLVAAIAEYVKSTAELWKEKNEHETSARACDWSIQPSEPTRNRDGSD